MKSPTPDLETTRVLVCCPTSSDLDVTRDLLLRASIPCVLCRSIAELCASCDTDGCAAIILTEEALDDATLPQLISLLERQPAWSDVPVLLFASSADADMSVHTMQSMDALRNVTLLERPIRMANVLSTIRASLRSRARQYQVRALLIELQRAHTEAEGANRLKDEFLATLSHELRTPLNAILGWTSMLKRGQIDVGRLPQVFDALDRNAQMQSQLIADVLEVSRIITGKLRMHVDTVDIGDVISRALDTVRPAAAGKHIGLDVHHDGHCLVSGDADRLQQIFWNLLSNAVKFTPAGGSVGVEIAPRGAHVSIAVVDTGAGIPLEFVPYVFDRFRQADQTTTRAHGGLGLGLAIVRHLTELHGGTVTAASDGIGKGARFEVLLPAAMAQPSSIAAQSRVNSK